jgi:hypothetical protein
VSLTESPNKESGLDSFAVLLAGGILFGIAATIFVLMAPHTPGGWRSVAASATVGAVLAFIDLRLARRFQRQGMPRTFIRFSLTIIVGAGLGVVWGLVAGSRPLWVPMLYGSFAAFATTAFGLVWPRTPRHRRDGASAAQDVATDKAIE